MLRVTLSLDDEIPEDAPKIARVGYKTFAVSVYTMACALLAVTLWNVYWISAPTLREAVATPGWPLFDLGLKVLTAFAVGGALVFVLGSSERVRELVHS